MQCKAASVHENSKAASHKVLFQSKKVSFTKPMISHKFFKSTKSSYHRDLVLNRQSIGNQQYWPPSKCKYPIQYMMIYFPNMSLHILDIEFHQCVHVGNEAGHLVAHHASVLLRTDTFLQKCHFCQPLTILTNVYIYKYTLFIWYILF